MKVAIGPSSFAQLDKKPLEMLKAAGVEIVGNPFGRRLTEEEIISHLEGIDGLIAGLEPLNEKVLQSAPNLKAIARVGIGMNNVDLDYAASTGVKVSNTPDGPTYSVAEMTVASLLTIARDIWYLNTELHANRWSKRIGMGLNGAKIFFIGFGRIGRKTKELLQAFGPEFYVYDPYIDESTIDSDVKLVSLEEGLKLADVISLHVSGVEEILKANEFNLMKDGVIILNSARGELINENDLVDAVDCGKVKGVWLDAFWKEPYEGKLQGYDNVLLSPHVGTYTKQCRSSMESKAVENLLRDLGVE